MPLSKLSRSLEGRGAVITGAGSGIGRACAELLSDLGCRVVVGDLKVKTVEETAKRIADEYGADRVKALKVDCAKEEELREFAKQASEWLGGDVWMLVNNAGVIGTTPLDRQGYEAVFARNIAINTTAQALLTRYLLPALKAGEGGRVVNIASTEGLGATLFGSPYVASKHASIGVTRALAVELGSQGVTVNAVCPGPIRTGMTSFIGEKQKAYFVRRLVPLRRYGYPEEVAHAVVGFGLPAMRWVNGAVMLADGGIMSNSALLPNRLPWEEVTADAKL
eukprot:Hpha_TRINITY_DN14552_c1_g1::TRINITY_DN14552_c1_g1_i1::g.46573::m.46573/K00059/fabG; 3-oxoacyl-[acyl-carrier protein] reductase